MTETTIVVEGDKSFFLAGRCELLDVPPGGNRETAWAEKHIIPNPAHKYVLGRFVEADRANHNKQFWALNDLRLAQPSISHSPMNLLHDPRHVLGAFVGTEMMYPMGLAEGAAEENPWIEALGVFWKWYFPQELAIVEAAHAMGSLFFSMECVSESITCSGEFGCNQEFDYAGPQSSTYCAHLNQGESIKQLNKPHFLGGALIVPPEKPGWPGATITDLSALVNEHRLEAELAYEGAKTAAPHLGPSHWEYLMSSLMKFAHTQPVEVPLQVSPSVAEYLFNLRQRAREFGVEQRKIVDKARQFSEEQRKKAADSGDALPDGSFPIKNVADLKNAIRAIGRAKNPAAAKKHIKARAKALGAEDLIPAGW